jgi:hypothetical protein
LLSKLLADFFQGQAWGQQDAMCHVYFPL